MVCNSGTLHMTLIQLDGSLQRVRESRPKTKTDSQTHGRTYTPTLRETVSHTLTSRGITKNSPMHNLFLWVAKKCTSATCMTCMRLTIAYLS